MSLRLQWLFPGRGRVAQDLFLRRGSLGTLKLVSPMVAFSHHNPTPRLPLSSHSSFSDSLLSRLTHGWNPELGVVGQQHRHASKQDGYHKFHEAGENSFMSKGVLVLCGLVSGLASCGLLHLMSGDLEREQVHPLGGLQVANCKSPDSSDRRAKQNNFLAEAVEIAAPAVVYIEKSERVHTFYGQQMAMSSGSGFIVDEKGYVLTNAHVVGNARRVNVKLLSGKVLVGTVTEIDQVSDLALVKLDVPKGEKLCSLKFGSSSNLRPGEWVVALGSPLSLSNTITAGIVSSVLRPSKELGLDYYKPDMEYVQTDAPITVGNSGGPLVNLDGEVIGVNTMTAGPGISFAIPSDFAKEFVKKASKTVKSSGTDMYAIGISMLSINPRLLRALQLKSSFPSDVSHGVFLANVWQNGAAALAGLRRGDVIVKINGKVVRSSEDVYRMVQTGKKLDMEVVRSSNRYTVSVIPEPLYS